MRTTPASLAPVAALVAMAILGVGGAGDASRAEAQEHCDGVRVVVDARAAGGTLTSRCAPGDPASGIRALEAAGHAFAYLPTQPGFVCTIDRRPEPCNGAPADAYWSYWYAEAGGTWSYAGTGAGSRDPAPGTVEGWRFGDGSSAPGMAPPAPPPPEPEPEPTPPGPEPEPPSATPDPEPRAAPSAPTTSGGSGPATSRAETPPDSPTEPASRADDDGATLDPEAEPPPDGSAPDERTTDLPPGSDTGEGDTAGGSAGDADPRDGTDTGPHPQDTADAPTVTGAPDTTAAAAPRSTFPTGGVVAVALLAVLAGTVAVTARRRRATDTRWEASA